jgi:HAD superfamily phosphoserine phosphatase-like hydrolase
MKNSDLKTDWLVASDFDQTLSFNDSGHVLSEMLGIRDFPEKVARLARTHLVQQGAELAYLLRHDPQFREVRREHLQEAGRRVRLKENVGLLAEVLESGLPEVNFEFFVISAAPADVVRAALEGMVPPERIFGTELEYDDETGEITAVRRVPAGYGKVAVLQELEAHSRTSPDRTIYIGDGSSDLYVMHHVNSLEGHTIAVSESVSIGRIAQRTVLSDNALSVLVPVLEDVLHWDNGRIRTFFASFGLTVQEWARVQTDWLTFHARAPSAAMEFALSS